MGLIHFGAPEQIVMALAKEFHLGRFVETGTFLGGTSRWASQHFSSVDTVEASEPIYKKAKKALSAYPNVRLHHGDSVACLPQVVASLDTPAVFWLDSHWCGEDTAAIGTQCPVLKEIDIINASAIDHFVIIDDCRLFSAPPPKPHRLEDWPTVEAIFHQLQKGGRRYEIVLAEDAIFAIPLHASLWFRSYMQERAATFPYVVVNSARPYAELSIAGHVRQAIEKTLRKFLPAPKPNGPIAPPQSESV